MVIEIERNFNTTKEKLYGLWTNAQTISDWFGVPVKIDSKVGGSLTFDFGEKEATTGIFKELSPFNTIAFTWNSFSNSQENEEATGETLVTVTFQDAPIGMTQMKLEHTGFKSEAARNDHQSGWNDYFNKWEQKIAR